MVPRKKRARYKVKARQICERRGIQIDLEKWAEIWRLLDEYDIEERPVHVYAIVDNALGVVKFGKSLYPANRLRALKTANPSDLKLCGFCEEKGELNEKAIHARLSEHRIGGEWFRLNEHTERVIKEIRAAAGVKICSN